MGENGGGVKRVPPPPAAPLVLSQDNQGSPSWTYSSPPQPRPGAKATIPVKTTYPAEDCTFSHLYQPKFVN